MSRVVGRSLEESLPATIPVTVISSNMGSHGSAAGDQASTGATIASPEELERFATATEHRVLTEPLRGVLAETALTGRNRCVAMCQWHLVHGLPPVDLQPHRNIMPVYLLIFMLVHNALQTLRQYEQAQAADGEGPARPVIGDESLPEALSRFRTLLHGFTKFLLVHMGTLHSPYHLCALKCNCSLSAHVTREHNNKLASSPSVFRSAPQLALAIEKCLMVTGEVGVTPRLPPPPLLSTLQHVNDNSKCHDPQPVSEGLLWWPVLTAHAESSACVLQLQTPLAVVFRSTQGKQTPMK
eukprot:1150464-Pelagomonas_calceolata.AAC.3